jgi:hypothetical protein
MTSEIEVTTTQPSQIVDAELVDEESIPPRLTIGSIGGLILRPPQKKLSYLNTMIYGESGVGKTLLGGMSAFVPEMAPLLVIDIEGGTHTLSHLDTDQILVVPDPDEQRPLKWVDIQKIYDDLYKMRHPFKTVMVDSGTEAQALNIGHLLGYNEKINIAADLPKFEEWNETTTQMRRFFRAFRDLRMNFICTALTYEQPDPRTAKSDNPRMVIRPSFTNKLRSEVPAFFDAVLYMYSKVNGSANTRWIQTDKDNYVSAKCRIPGIKRAIQDPTIERMYDMLIRNPGAVTLDPTTQPADEGMMRKKK